MGEARTDAARIGFDGSVKLQFHGADVSSDGGLFPYRDLDEALALTAQAAAQLTDSRTGSNIRHSVLALLRQSVFSRLVGYEDVNDADRLSVDPVMRQGRRGPGHRAGRGLDQRDQLVRDAVAHVANEPRGSDGDARPVGRSGHQATSHEEAHPRYGQFGQRDPRRTRRQCL